MAHAGICPACGTKLPRGSAYCPSCGRASGAAALVIETVDDDELPPLPPRRTSTDSRRRSLLVGAAVAGSILVAAVIIGVTREDGAGAAPSTTVAPTSTLAPPLASSTLPLTTPTTAASSTPATGAVLPTPSGAEVVALLHPSGQAEVVRLNLDNGASTRRVMPTQMTSGDLLDRTGGLVWTDGNSVRILGDDGKVRPVSTPSPSNVAVFEAKDPRQFWVYLPQIAQPEVLLYEVPGSTPIRSVELPPRARPVGTDPEGRLLLQADDGGTFRFDPNTGSAQLVTPGRVVALGRTVLVEDTCDANLGCALYLRDLATGTRKPLAAFVGPTLDEVAPLDVPARLSPDEHWLVTFTLAPKG
jgi:hypothetical protein